MAQIANEVRRGNWVDYHGSQLQVTGISDAYIVFEEPDYDVVNPDDVKGIELTPEWLQRLGFDLIPVQDNPFTEPKMPYWCNEGFLLFFNEGESNKGQYMIGVGEQRFGVYSTVTRRWITEVHTLQNAFYAWTGRELELKK